MEWRNLKVGQRVIWSYNDFDGKGEYTGTVEDVNEERAIINEDCGLKLWCDDDTSEMFYNVCPICNKKIIGYPALSRRDNKTEICSDCGTTEALIDFLRTK